MCVSHTHTNKEKTLIANSLLNACYTPLDLQCYFTLRAEFAGHNSVLFVIALILVTLSGKMCCCSLYCVHHIVVSFEPLLHNYFSCCCIFLVATNCGQKPVICEITDCCCVAFCAVTAPHSGSSTASHPQICVGR